jgi:DNA gyrase subunit A
MGRATSGVTGMKFRGDDSLLSMTVIRARHTEVETEDVPDEEKLYVFTVTDGGFAKKTTIDQYRLQGRGGIGIKAMEITEKRGELVGGLVLTDTDDVISVTEGGQITRSLVSGVPAKGRGTMGVSFVKFKGDDRVVTIARNAELPSDDEAPETDEAVTDDSPTDEEPSE